MTKAITGEVFHIIHGSFVDGHGIRTTVFLKGCPLRCLWCCNPEGQEKTPELKATLSRCNFCGNCLSVCPPRAIAISSQSGEKKIAIDRELCTNCGKCVEACYTGALETFGETMTVDEVHRIVAKDREYYKRSGGGVSIGGGEPTLQPRFTYELMKRCQADGIHVAIDTCGYTATKLGRQILEEADLLLFDVKGVNEEDHRRHTGVSNRIILKNLARLGEMGRPIIIRMPLIPGFNDSRENIVEAARFLSRYKSIEKIHLLSYHQFGTIKYTQLGRPYPLPSLAAQGADELAGIQQILESYGLQTQLGG